MLEIATSDLNEDIVSHIITGSLVSIGEAPETTKTGKRGRFVIEGGPLERVKTGFTSSP